MFRVLSIPVNEITDPSSLLHKFNFTVSADQVNSAPSHIELKNWDECVGDVYS